MLFDNSAIAYIGDVTGVYGNAFGFNILEHGFTGKNVAASGFRSYVIKDGKLPVILGHCPGSPLYSYS